LTDSSEEEELILRQVDQAKSLSPIPSDLSNISSFSLNDESDLSTAPCSQEISPSPVCSQQSSSSSQYHFTSSPVISQNSSISSPLSGEDKNDLGHFSENYSTTSTANTALAALKSFRISSSSYQVDSKSCSQSQTITPTLTSNLVCMNANNTGNDYLRKNIGAGALAKLNVSTALKTRDVIENSKEYKETQEMLSEEIVKATSVLFTKHKELDNWLDGVFCELNRMQHLIESGPGTNNTKTA